MEHIPRLGEEFRFSEGEFGKVINVCFCLDEDSHEGQRVNITVKIESYNTPPQRKKERN